ncbi:MAG: cytochrome C oxidase subunit IV family protein [Actinobacteria bacterium]|nr:cytochrome C oxidase subunit IV family protein [Actinomycetota bacterium]MBU1492865.1 cytochrome C oxidase subunit IV family protein [Actinomycetota bacterium]MBU1864981.1 cytochrome C oxidase subunit IV family protein [Actinomycetota bacterium]
MTDATVHHQPTPRDYWVIAGILFVITAIEISVAYVDAFDPVVAPVLITLSAVKFALVVGWFMHLKYDLKRYRALFYIGLVAAPILFGAVLFTFGVLIGD